MADRYLPENEEDYNESQFQTYMLYHAIMNVDPRGTVSEIVRSVG